MSSHETFMREAVEAGLRVMRDGSGEPFGAVVVKDGEIVAAAGNRSHALKTPTAHAELLAINLACEKLGASRLDGCTVYASGQPCIMCLAAMLITGVDTVYYANTHAEIGYDGGPPVRAFCGAFGATGGDAEKFGSAPGLTVIHLPVPEAKALAAPFRP